MAETRVTGTGVQVLEAGGTPDTRLTGMGLQVLALDEAYVPSPGAFHLTWDHTNPGADEQRIYHALEPMDPEDLPAPAAVVAAAAKSYTHALESLPVTVHHYRVSVVGGDPPVELVSDEIAVQASFRGSTQLAIVVASTTHGATENTQQALLDAGFLDDNIALVEEGDPIPPVHAILVVRGVGTQAQVDVVQAAHAKGVPVCWGSTPGGGSGSGVTMGATLARLTGTWTAASSADGYDGDAILDVAHPVIDPLEPGKTVLFTGGNWGYSLDDGAAFVGTLLANGDPDVTALAGNAALIAIEAGTNDLDANPTPARSVVWTNLYGGQSEYTEAGREYLARIIEWLCGKT